MFETQIYFLKYKIANTFGKVINLVKRIIVSFNQLIIYFCL